MKAIKLKDDHLISTNCFDPTQDEFVAILTTKGTGKRIRLNELEISNRTRRGLQIIREVKTNPYKILKTFIVGSRSELGIKNADINFIKASELPISDRYSTGKELTKHQLTDAFLVANLEKGTKEQVELLEPVEVEVEEIKEDKKEEPLPKKERISLKEIDDRLMTIDDFLK